MLMKAVVLAVIVVVVGPFLRLMWNIGLGLHYHKHHPGKCRVVKTFGTGSEDFQILTSGLTFISSGLMMPTSGPNWISYVKSKGQTSIQLLDLNNPDGGAKRLTIRHGKDFNPEIFRPHGLSVIEDKVKGEHLIYIINHAENEDDRVEKFRFNPKTVELQHEKSFFSDALRVTNDLMVIQEDQFYITNWLYFKGPFLTVLEHIYQPPFGAILFYNGTGMTTVADGMFDPNSIVLSKDKRFAYVSLPVLQKVYVFKRNSNLDLKLVQEVNVHTGLDNFHLSENGDSLYGGCHPIAYSYAKYGSHPAERISPSQAIRLPLKDGLVVEEEITQEFYDQGSLISGSSIAGVYKNKLLVGSVIDTLAVCDLPTI